MELRCLGEPLMRFRAPPLLSFLAPSVASAWRQPTASRRAHVVFSSSSNHFRHGFHSTPSQSSSDSKADLDFLDDIPEKPPSRPSQDSSSARKTDNISKIDSLLNSTFNVPNPEKRQPYTPPTESSASMLDTQFKASQYYNMRERGNRSPGSLARSMNFPDVPGAKTSSDLSSAMNEDQPRRQIDLSEARRSKRTVRARASVGRTVEIDADRGFDFGRALRTLDIQCAINRVRADQQRQRFHERPGMKRKRLKSERWRRLFRESFKATVGRVKEMRRKGW